MAGVQSVVPRYLAGFNCIGGECPDTCCAGWDVTVDKAQFKKLRAGGEIIAKGYMSCAVGAS